MLKDDLAEVLDAIRDAEVLVMATPIYFAEISSQLKTFIDRTFSYLVPDYPTNPLAHADSPRARNWCSSRLRGTLTRVYLQTYFPGTT